MLTSAVNVSEGRDEAVLARLADAAGPELLDVHRDGDHHRSVLTLGGAGVEAAVARLVGAAVRTLDLRDHRGVHPRFGVVDVVPFTSWSIGPDGWLAPGPDAAAVAARRRFAVWAASELGVPVACYGPAAAADPPMPDVAARTLPELRAALRAGRPADLGPASPHPTAGTVAAGVRPALVAYNLWLVADDLALARRIATAVRSPQLRTLGLAVGAAVQVSCNLVEPWAVGPGAAFDAVAAHAAVARAELVGLLPAGVLAAEDPARWAELDLDPDRTIEARLEQAGLDGGSG